MLREIAQQLTDSIDDITRKWVEDLRLNTRTEVHKDLLSADIVDGVKGMLGSLALAIEAHETPAGEVEPTAPKREAVGATQLSGRHPRIKTTRPLRGPLEQALAAAASLGGLRHRQKYNIEEVVYEYAKLRQEIWGALLDTALSANDLPAPELIKYINRLIDELMLATVENFYKTSVRDLEKRAIRDPATQLYNKDYFRQRLNEELRRAVRYTEPITVAILDMDHLKAINDTYGHPVGDEAIKAVASAIRSTCRQTDVPCRYGGDEFTVILPETTKEQARIFAERVMNAIASISILVVRGGRTQAGQEEGRSRVTGSLTEEDLVGKSPLYAPSPTVSIGLASFPEDARNPETLLAKADDALYKAKNEGRNKIAD